MTKRTYNPAWPDSRKARAERQRKRREKLDALAQTIGYETWALMETAALRGEYKLAQREIGGVLRELH